MKGVVFLGDRKLELRRFPDPTPGPRDVILAIKASGTVLTSVLLAARGYLGPASVFGSAGRTVWKR